MLLSFMYVRQHKKCLAIATVPALFSDKQSLQQGGKAAEIMELTLFLAGFFRLMLDLI